MPLDWLNTPLDADIGELIAQRKRGKAIETLRRQLQGRLAPPVGVRLQLADLLMQAGRIEEAVPVLLGLADEFAADGFVAKAVAILKRVDRVQPGRADIAERLERLVHQQKRVSELPSRPRSAVPEFGIEEFAEGQELIVPAEELEPAGGGAATGGASGERAPGSWSRSRAGAHRGGDRRSGDGGGADRGSLRRPIESATIESAEPIVETPAPVVEPVPAPPPDSIESLVVDAAPAPAGDATPVPDSRRATIRIPPPVPPTVADVPSNPCRSRRADRSRPNPRRLRRPGRPASGAGSARALWRFLASFPGAEEGAAPLRRRPRRSRSRESTRRRTAPEGARGGRRPTVVASDRYAASIRRRGQPSRRCGPRARHAESSDAAAPSDAPAPSEPSIDEALSEEAFRDHLLDIVEDVLHRPAAPAPAVEMDRARVLDLARRMVASRLFKDLSDEELLAIVRGLRLHTYEAGDIVVTEGEPGQSLFTLTTGPREGLRPQPRPPQLRGGRRWARAISSARSPASPAGRAARPSWPPAPASSWSWTVRPSTPSRARTRACATCWRTSYIERASSPEVAAVRAVPCPTRARGARPSRCWSRISARAAGIRACASASPTCC